MDPSESELLALLDHTPQTVAELANKTGQSPDAIEETLIEAQNEGWAVDWGERWATTWRAKLRLDRSFFARWIPGSLAAGFVLAGIVVWVNGAGAFPSLLPWVLLALGGLLVGWGAWAGRA